MEQNENFAPPEAATDEPASPANPPAPDSIDAAQARHGPPRPDPDLTRSGAAPPLDAASLLASYAPVATDAVGRAVRADGFTPERQRAFLTALAACGVVADACRAARISRDTAYALRNRAEGRAFAIAWDAALLIGRGALGDELSSRAMHGVVERIYRNGELWGERHRHDNRLAMAVLTRLDRQAEGMGEGAATARIVAQEWDQFLDIVEAGGEDAASFLSARVAPADCLSPDDGDEAAAPPPGAAEIEASARILDRLTTYGLFGHGLLEEADTCDLDPREMERWTPEQWNRADYSGLLDRLGREEWPAAAEPEGGTNGGCPGRQDISGDEASPEVSPSGLDRLRFEYRLRFDAPEPPAPDGFDVWEDQERDLWMTDYPPPEGFDGVEEGRWGDDHYRRELSERELRALADDLAIVQAEDEAERAAARAAAEAERDRAFGFDAPAPGGEEATDEEAVEPAVRSSIVAAQFREGESG